MSLIRSDIRTERSKHFSILNQSTTIETAILSGGSRLPVTAKRNRWLLLLLLLLNDLQSVTKGNSKQTRHGEFMDQTDFDGLLVCDHQQK